MMVLALGQPGQSTRPRLQAVIEMGELDVPGWFVQNLRI
jgi:hypothetical protein